MSRFKILAERHDSCDPEDDLRKDRELREADTKTTEGGDGDEHGDRKVEPLLDVDGDLDILHRYAKTICKVHVQTWWASTTFTLFVLILCSITSCTVQIQY